MRKNKTIKNFILSVVTASCLVSLAACGITAPEYTEEEIDKIGEYSALLVLGDEPGRLVDIEESAEPEVQEQEENVVPDEDEEIQDENQEPADETENSETDETEDGQSIEVIEKVPEEEITEIALEQKLGLADGVVLTYKGYEWTQSLTDQSESFFYDAEDGNSFLIVNYNIYNASGAEQTIDLMFSGVTFTAYINHEKKVIAMEMPIAEDMSTYLGKIANGSGVDVILMFECENTFVNNITSLKLLVRGNEGTDTFILE